MNHKTINKESIRKSEKELSITTNYNNNNNGDNNNNNNNDYKVLTSWPILPANFVKLELPLSARVASQVFAVYLTL